MRLAGIRAVVFDLDDTLYSERDYTRSGLRAVAAFLEDPNALEEMLALERADPAAPLYSRWLASRWMDETLWLPQLLHIHRSHKPTLALPPDVREVLQGLRRPYKLGLVSDGRLEQQQAKAAALGLTDLLDAVVFSDALGRERWKPDPAPYQRALALLGANPSEAVYVGDNPAKDFLGARRAGMRSIRVRSPDGLHATAEPHSPEAAPDFEIARLGDLEACLSTITYDLPPRIGYPLGL